MTAELANLDRQIAELRECKPASGKSGAATDKAEPAGGGGGWRAEDVAGELGWGVRAGAGIFNSFNYISS